MHVEVAGAGIAGLASATMLAMRGWTARVHEQDSAVREVGAGIYIKPNSMRVLDVLGVGPGIRQVGLKLERGVYRDGRTGNVYQNRYADDSSDKVWICPRQVLIQSIERVAREVGVDIVVGSKVLAAQADGVLRTADGDFPGDLVIGADGVSSAVRESLGLTRMTRRLPSVATRYLAPTSEIEPDKQTTMWWSGSRRIGIAPCGSNQTYIYMISHERDIRGSALPMDLDSWTESFPMLADQLKEIQGLPAIQNNYRIVTCKAWHRGRVAIVGDAAHGLPPLLGQGAGLALSNANALATSVGNISESIPNDLQRWERSFRHYADVTQHWSMHLDWATNKWPKPLLGLRKPYLWALGSLGALQRRMSIADTFPIQRIQ